MKKLNINKIDEARLSFPSMIKKTPLEFNARLSRMYNCKVYLKREDLQIVRSYKIRGAFNLINSLNISQRKRGVVCASAGNHAQGFAISCSYFKINGTIFMPKTTPMQKIQRTKKFGGKYVEVKLFGDTYDSCYEESLKFSKKTLATFIHPFDDLKTIIGQGTIANEILRDINEKIDFIVSPIGGGGLISGLGSYFKERSPQTKILGVEPLGASAMYESLKAKKLVKLDNIDTFVDGASVKKVGKLNFEITRSFLEDIVRVPENRVCSTILDLLREEGMVVEPAGALAIDALKDLKKEIVGKVVVCVVSGGNFDFDRLSEVKERSIKYEGLKRYYVVKFPQRAGALKEFLNYLGREDDITRFEYLKKTSKENGPALIGIETTNKNNFEKLNNKLSLSGIDYKDITNDDFYFSLLV